MNSSGNWCPCPIITFWADDVSLAEESSFFHPAKLLGHRQVTDAHLLAIALRKKGRLATLDKGLRSLVPPEIDPKEAVHLIQPLE